MSDWKTVSASTAGLLVSSLGQGLTVALGLLSVAPGSGIAFDGSGNVTIQPGVGLQLSGGYLTVNTGTGLGTSGSQIIIPGGAITNALLAALAVAQANIQNNAVGSAQIANAAIGTVQCQNAFITNALLGTAVVGTANIQSAAITDALIVSLDAGKITAGTITAAVSMTAPTITTTTGGGAGITLSSGTLTATTNFSGGGDTALLTGNTLTFANHSAAFTATHYHESSVWTTSSSGTIQCGTGGSFLGPVFAAYRSPYQFLVSLAAGIVQLTNMALQMGSSTVIDYLGNGSFASMTLGTALAVAQGGTGATSVSGILSTLGIPSYATALNQSLTTSASVTFATLDVGAINATGQIWTSAAGRFDGGLGALGHSGIGTPGSPSSIVDYYGTSHQVVCGLICS